jgi:prepilin-type N-terminal cleavage/methylation domain-containing protein
MKNIKNFNSKQKGFTLIEMGIVFVLISIAAGFILSGSEGLQDGPKMNSIRDTHMGAVGAIQEFYGSQSYVGLSTEAMVTGGLVAKDLSRGSGVNTSLATPYSGTTFQVLTAASPSAINFSTAAGSAGDQAFMFKYDNVDQAACKSFVPGVSKHSIMVKLGEAGGTLSDIKPLGGDFNAGTMLTQCAHAFVDIEFYYGN